MTDNLTKEIFELIDQEKLRQGSAVELIASENYVSDDILAALGSCLTNKYAEGYPGKRYYGGCETVDRVEGLCCALWKRVFNTDYHVNVQPHSGSQANMAALRAILEPGDKILSMELDCGGHLTHGAPVSMTGKLYDIIGYGVNRDGYIDYDDIKAKAILYKPKVIIAGASSYSREINFAKFKEISDSCGAKLMVDMAHIAGLVAAGEHISPFGYADIITTTTHKTLRGARGGLIFCREELAGKVDAAVFPCVQGGPLMNVIAAKAITAAECLKPEYYGYIGDVVENAKAMACEFIKQGFEVVTGGTDNHMFVVDFTYTHPAMTGAMAEKILEKYGVTVNKNCVPYEKRSPKETSGIRIGTPAMTTKGWSRQNFIDCAQYICAVLNHAYKTKEIE